MGNPIPANNTSHGTPCCLTERAANTEPIGTSYPLHRLVLVETHRDAHQLTSFPALTLLSCHNFASSLLNTQPLTLNQR